MGDDADVEPDVIGPTQHDHDRTRAFVIAAVDQQPVRLPPGYPSR